MALLERVANLLSVDLAGASAQARRTLIVDIENQLMQLKTQAATAIAALRRLEAETPKSRKIAVCRREVEVLTAALVRLEARRVEAQTRRPRRPVAKRATAENTALEQMLRSLKAERKAQ